jgi:hypothetical protein
MNRLLLWGIFAASSFFINACSSLPPVSERIDSANQLAKSAGFEKATLSTNQFDLISYQKISKRPTETLVIYIEGDGSAWKTGFTPSDNPTPNNPLALLLAIQDTRPTVIYLARPCQFIALPSKGCSESIWTNARFNKDVIDSNNQAIEILKKQYQARELILIGYSGGGAVASLVAAQRKDVKALITVAGNLDTDAWVQLFSLDPLTGSLNPAAKAKELSPIKQTHFIGGVDQVIPLSITQSYLNKLQAPNQPQLIEIKEYGHVCCWQKTWPALLNRIQP